jgi:isoaspartyl peptidase/L-asparaginase-like protein (Ntn-hydrolase superfamily)
LDAVEQGIRLVEADVSNTSVGAGGTPNAAGVVQLDACIMHGPGHQAGSVAGLEGILHPISVARAVMEKTRHVMLVGPGAQDFAIHNGFEKVNLLSDGRRTAWEKWRAEQNQPAANSADNHDTIALIGVSADGTVAGGCSTSGLGYKLPGRVGDSPILGSGLYVDNEVGGAGATGTGENVMRYCATFMIVEAMRHGMSPQAACVAAIRRISQMDPRDISELHINFVAIDKKGNVGAAGTDKEFRYAVTDTDSSLVIDAEWVK